MGFFRSDPQPVQLTPHVPAAALVTGSQPPRTAVAGALAMACVLAAWPAQGEPRPIQPLQGRSQIAPLTLVYGQQPPRIDPMQRVQTQTVRVSWPDDKEPRLQFNNQYPGRRYIAPLVLTYGQQPPIAGPLTSIELNLAVRSWDAPFVYPQSEPYSAPLAPPVVQADRPFVRAPYTVLQSWNADFVPIQCSESIAPSLAPASSDNPPVVGSISPAEMSVVRQSWEPARPEPPQTVKIAPLTLAYGQNPPLDGPLSEVELNVLVGQTPGIWWSAQQASPSASWNVPVVSGFIPFTRTPQSVLNAWLPPDNGAQSRGPIAPLTLTYGNQPSPRPALSTQQRTTIDSPRESWGAQSVAPNAGWNVPVVSAFIPSARQRPQILASWQEPWRRENARTYVAPLIVPAVTSTVTGKYKPEHDSALTDVGGATGFSAEHTSALTDVANSTGFAAEHNSALKDVGDAGV